MDLGVREIGDAADVVDVEVRDDDVADVLAPEAEPFDLSDRRFLVVEERPEEAAGRAYAMCRIVAVIQSVSAVDEKQAVVRLDEQHMADQSPSTPRMHRSTVEVVNLHEPSPASNSERPICVTRLAASK